MGWIGKQRMVCRGGVGVRVWLGCSVVLVLHLLVGCAATQNAKSSHTPESSVMVSSSYKDHSCSLTLEELPAKDVPEVLDGLCDLVKVKSILVSFDDKRAGEHDRMLLDRLRSIAADRGIEIKVSVPVSKGPSPRIFRPSDVESPESKGTELN